MGKDTVGAMLQNIYKFNRLAFADPLRRFVSDITGLSLDQLTDGDLKETPLPQFGNKSPRFMMQTVGTEWGRELIDRDLWLNVAMAKIDAARSVPWVVTDVRFDNEAQAIRRRGGVIWHIQRSGVKRVEAHVSERGVIFDRGDLVISNDHDKLHLMRDLIPWALETSVGVPE